jgi:hypothetical protein
MYPFRPPVITFPYVERERARRQGLVMNISEPSPRCDETGKIAAAVEGQSIKALLIEA